MRSLHVVVPEGIDDPRRPSGGNVYDRRVCDGLSERGWSVAERPVPGGWPWADTETLRRLGRELDSLPEGGVVLVDGLVACAAADVVVPQAARLRLCVLLHLPLGATTVDAAMGVAECAVLKSASAVITTSAWSRRWLIRHYGLPATRLQVAEPGVDAAPLVRGTDSGDRLLCVAAVTPGKGHDRLLAALGEVADLPWQCVCVGNVRGEPEHVDRLLRQARDTGVADRVHFVGPRTGAGLGAAYASADLLVLASRFESYGMVATEALAHGLPVLATAVGGLPETIGRSPDGRRPGLLVPPDDPGALADALRRWLGDRDLRESLRKAARMRRTTLSGWDTTTHRICDVLAEVAS